MYTRWGSRTPTYLHMTHVLHLAGRHRHNACTRTSRLFSFTARNTASGADQPCRPCTAPGGYRHFCPSRPVWSSLAGCRCLVQAQPLHWAPWAPDEVGPRLLLWTPALPCPGEPSRELGWCSGWVGDWVVVFSFFSVLQTDVLRAVGEPHLRRFSDLGTHILPPRSRLVPTDTFVTGLSKWRLRCPALRARPTLPIPVAPAAASLGYAQQDRAGHAGTVRMAVAGRR